MEYFECRTSEASTWMDALPEEEHWAPNALDILVLTFIGAIVLEMLYRSITKMFKFFT